MRMQEYVIDEQSVEWKESSRKERREVSGFAQKRLADGLYGRPSVTIATQPEGFENAAHFHTEAQFVVLLEGTVKYPQHLLNSIAVHYSDANSPYGPFHVGSNFKIAVLRKRAAGQVYMSDIEGRKRRNAHGRELYGQMQENAWTQLIGLDGIEHQVLIDSIDGSGPSAQILRCAPNTQIDFGAPLYGAFHVVVGGSVGSGDNELGLYSMRYVQGDEAPTPLIAGVKGASIVDLTFDRD